MSHRIRTPLGTLIASLALSACLPSIVVGDSPQDDDGGGTSSTTAPDLTTGGTTDGGTPTGTTGAATGEPLPGVCGDGVVNPGEACDDGNDEPDDGCDAACTRTGDVVWAVTRPGDLRGIAVAGDGTIYVSGAAPVAFLAAFAPDGTELWQTQVQGSGELAVDPAGRIFVLDWSAILAFAPDSTMLWSVEPHGPFETNVPVGIDVGVDGLYTSNYAPDSQEQIVVRRQDLATGDIAWEVSSPADERVTAEDLSVVGDRVVIVGRTAKEDQVARPMLAVFDTAGTLLSLELDDTHERQWLAVDGLGGDDLVFAGLGGSLGCILLRLGPDQDVQWLNTVAALPNQRPEQVVVGPGERIAVVSSDLGKDGVSAVRLHDGAGDLSWSSQFSSPLADVNDEARAVGFGPDLLVAGGVTWTVHEDNTITSTWWLRGFALE